MTPPFLPQPARSGFASTTEDAAHGTMDLQETLFRHPAATFLMKASGDSLAGAGIRAGDILVVDRSIAPRDGLVVVAVVSGELVVRRLPVRAEAGGFEVWGVVTYCIHPLA